MSTAAPTGLRSKGRKGLIALVTATGVALLASLVALALALSGMIAIPGISQASGELVLQSADELGLDPFTDTGLATPRAESGPQPVARPAAVTANVVSGASVGLYGGSTDDSRCEVDQLVAFLGANPAKAQAWIGALNADSQLRWGTGTLAVSDIPDYIASLTPLVLLSDTLVTNHGFVDGRATPFQAVLQAGTSVLVDRFGVPRARCMCGNPLILPQTPPAEPTIVGDPWDGFDVTTVLVVQQTVVVVTVFEVVPYPAGGDVVQVPAGTCELGQPCASPWGNDPTPVLADPGPSTPEPTLPPADWTPVDPVGVPASDPTTTAPAEVTFVNLTDQPIDVYWIDFAGAPIWYYTLGPGESYVQTTTEAHLWVVTSGSSTTLLEASVPAGPSTYSIR